MMTRCRLICVLATTALVALGPSVSADSAEELFKEARKVDKWARTDKDLESACAKYSKITEKFPDTEVAVRAVIRLGVCNRALKKNDKAIALLEKAVSKAGDKNQLSEVLWYLSMAYDAPEKEKEKEEILARLAKECPNTKYGGKACFKLGNLYYRRGEKEKAVDYFEEYLKRQPDDEMWESAQGMIVGIYLELDDIDTATSKLGEIVQYSKKEKKIVPWMLYQMMGNLYETKNRLKDALDIYEQGLKDLENESLALCAHEDKLEPEKLSDLRKQIKDGLLARKASIEKRLDQHSRPDRRKRR